MRLAFLKSAFKHPTVPPAGAALALIAAMMVFAHHVSAAVAVDATSTGTGTGTTINVTHTVSGTDRLMLVGISAAFTGVNTLTASVVWDPGGASELTLTQVGTQIGSANDVRMWIFQGVGPATGTKTLRVTFNNAPPGKVVGVMSFTGVNQSTPLGTFESAQGNSATASVNVTSATGELVFDTMAIDGTPTLTVGAGQTQRWNLAVGSLGKGGGSTEAGAASVTMSWSLTAEKWAIGGVSVKPTVIGDFNVYETSTAAGAIYGFIKTKIAGASISLAIIRLNAGKTAINTTFTGTVRVELLDASDNTGALDANACRPIGTGAGQWKLIQTISTTLAFVSGDLGRKTISFTQPNSYRDVRIRVSYPTTSPTAIGCSTDNFAIRPNTLTSFSVTDATETTAGTTRTLNLLTFAATTPIHKAGRPFTVRATAVNAAGTPATTTLYTGAPTPTLTACVGAACTATFGTLTLGASFASGVLTSNAATYNNVGSFALQLVDSSFANVDASDGSTTTERNITSSVVSVGRFVPDHFAVAYNTPVFGTTCGSFTYVGQAFNYTTAPVITVTAQDFADNTTTLYATSGSWWRITNASLTGKAYTAAAGTLDSSGITGTDPVIAASGGGIGTLTFKSGTGGLLFTRSTPVAPFDADVSLAINVIDADGVTYASNPARFGAATAGNGIAFSGGKPMRFGQLALGNALGSELLNLPIPIQTQYWNGTSFVTNTLDSCTTITASNIALSNYQGALTSGNLPSGNISISGAFNAGVGNLKLTEPSSAVNGSVDLCVDLGGDATCTATSAGMSYLQGVWSGSTYTIDPRSRAAFGFSKGSYGGGGRDPFVYQRENY
jgi:hypothetical protein